MSMSHAGRRGSDAAVHKRGAPEQAPAQRHSRDSSRLVQLAAALNQGPAAARVQGHARAHAGAAAGDTKPVQRAEARGGHAAQSQESAQGGGLAQLSCVRSAGAGAVIQRHKWFDDADLRRARTRLSRVDEVGLGPLDVSEAELDRRPQVTGEGFTGHEYADALAATRRGITLLRAQLNERVRGNPETTPGFLQQAMAVRRQAMGYDDWRDNYRDVVAVGDPNYARESLEEWTRRSANASAGLPNYYLEDVTRALYDNWRPDNDDATHRDGAIRTFDELKRLERGRRRTRVKVYAQERNRRGPTRLEREDGLDAALSPFSYRINPDPGRPFDRSGEKSRLSLNMDVQDGAHNARRMRETVRRDPRRVNQSKIMGPASIGKRVDDGVVYLNRADIQWGGRVATRLGLRGPAVNVAPPGMHLLAPGVSYAEYAADSSTSHGESRGQLVNSAIRAQRDAEQQGNDEDSLTDFLGRAVERAGYDRNRPDLLAGTREERATRRMISAAMARRRKAMGYDD